ncbi:hypothetical protein BS78_01G273700 [Paspalum vaginatum]|nr:hypothetical protein BS78_01G273700 [Paspalum vaginatum]
MDISRLFRYALATADRVSKFSKHKDDKCKYCSQVEDDVHLFFTCALPRATWFCLPLYQNRITDELILHHPNLRDAICYIINYSDSSMHLHQTISTLWYIWKARNDKRFNSKNWTAQQIHMNVKADLNSHAMILNINNYGDNSQTPNTSTDQTTVSATHWVSTVDASFLPLQVSPTSGIPGLGMFLKGTLQGVDFRLQIQAHHSQASNAVQAEAQALLLATLVIATLQVQDCTIYLDNQELISTLNSSSPGQNSTSLQLRPILAEIVSNDIFSCCSFRKIRRQHNSIAHNLAKRARQTVPSQPSFIGKNPLHGICPLLATFSPSPQWGPLSIQLMYCY